METVLILVKQILQMFLLGAIGFLLVKAKKITPEGTRTMGNILIYVSLPAVIISSFLVERTREHLLGMICSAAGAFSNPGFFGVPLIIASVG